METINEELHKLYLDSKYLTISVESFGDYIKRIIEKIKGYVKALIDYLSDVAIYNVPLYRLREGIESLISKTHASKQSNNPDPITLTKNIPLVSVKYRPMTNIRDLSLHVDALNKYIKSFHDYKDKLLSVDYKNLEPELLVATNPIDNFKSSYLYDLSDRQVTSNYLLNNRQIYIGTANTKSINVDNVKSIKIELINALDNPLEIPESIEFDRFPNVNQVQFLKRLLNLHKTLNDHYSGPFRAKRIRALETLNKELDRLEKDIGNKSETELRREVQEIAVFTGWLNSLEEDFFKLATRVMRNGLSICTANMR